MHHTMKNNSGYGGDNTGMSAGKPLSYRTIEKLKSINPWHFLWIGVILSEVFTLAASWLINHLLWGRMPREVVVTGLFDALFVSLIVSLVIIVFVSQISKLQQEIKSRTEAEKQIRYLAYYDVLTTLPNRELFKELLKKALAYAQRNDFVMAVLFVDLDNFKRINDTLGHDMGDRLLQAVAGRLVKMIRNSDYIARIDENEMTEVASRFGGDEFILLLNRLAHINDASKVASRILEDMSSPFELDGHEVFITASIGISLYPSDGENVDDLVKNADLAMYHAKARGRNNYQHYSESMNAVVLEHLTLANKLHKALENEEFLLHYQPKHSMPDGRINGLEALLRWRADDNELVPPSRFVPILEETGLIIPLGEWILRTACLQNKTWQQTGLGPIAVSVNISSRQFDQKNLIEVVTQALRDANLSPQYLELEITESTIMQDPEEAITTLHRLKNMGVRISVDDFGAGYSSLNYLKRVPLDALKIDRSFVMNLATSSSDEAIIKAIIALAHSLKLKVVAEGVETVEQLSLLRELGCDEIQGFLFSRPLPVEKVQGLFLKKTT
jgi:diguanylate cyclase (GGDEF)-like protein